MSASPAGRFPHITHSVVAVFTLGVWIPVWILHRLVSSKPN